MKINLDGQNFEIDIRLVTSKNVGSSDTAPEYATLDVGPVAKLHIEEDLVSMGLVGHFCVKNPGQLLERVKAIRSTEDTVYLYIRISDLDSPVDEAKDRVITFIAILETSTGMSSNVINNNILFTFEEATTSLLKKTSMKNLFPNWNKDTVQVGNYLEVVIDAWVQSLLTTSTRYEDIVDVGQFKINNGTVGNIQAFWWNVEDSVYDVLYRIAESIQIQDGSNNTVPILKINNVRDYDNDVARKFTFKEVFTPRHHEFLRALKNNTGGDFSDVYSEAFTMAPAEIETGGSPEFNTVESFEVIKADVGRARDEMWGDFLKNDCVSSDITNLNIETLRFEDIVDSFERNDLISDQTDWFSAIPVLSPNERKIHNIDRLEQKDPGEFSSIIEDHLYNRVKRSFLFLNDSVLFTCKGQVFRKPGYFIKINGGEVFGDSPENIWLVTSVTHSFTELDYKTDIVAVRLFGNSNLYKELVSNNRVDNNSSSAGGGSLASTAAVENNDALPLAPADSNLTPVGDIDQTGVVDRSRINEELKNDPDLQRLLFASAKAEVGSQGDAAIQGYMETVTNRSLATGRTLRSTLSDPGYYPASTKNKLNKTPPDYSSQMNKVLAGSNITNYATDNASNQSGNPLARRRLAAGNPGTTIGGELFYTNVHGSKVGSYDGVPKHRVWRDGQIKNAPPTRGTT